MFFRIWTHYWRGKKFIRFSIKVKVGKKYHRMSFHYSYPTLKESLFERAKKLDPSD